MKINIGVSNRHVHLTKEDYDLLFGDEYKIIKNLSQPSDFVTDKVVTLKTSKYEIKNVKVLGHLEIIHKLKYQEVIQLNLVLILRLEKVVI